MKINELNKDNLNEIKFKEVPITTVMRAIDVVVDECVYKNENNVLTYNSIYVELMKWVLFAALYTDIDGDENCYSSYDMLVNSGFKRACEFTSAFGEYSILFDSRIDDKMRENSVENILSKELDKCTSGLSSVMNSVNKMLDKGDPNKIAKYLSKGIEIIANKLPDLSTNDGIEKAISYIKGSKLWN